MKMIPTARAIYLRGGLLALAATIIDPFTPDMNYKNIVSQMRGRGQVMNVKAKTVLGWEPQVSLDEGLSRSEAWLRAQGYLS
jgi:nucleoside-diphosphate-sugar epimerase